MAADLALLTTSAVAKRLHVSAETVRRWHKRGRLPAVELPSGQLRFREIDVEAVLATAGSPERAAS